MALIHLHTAPAATPFLEFDTWSLNQYLTYSRRDDCALLLNYSNSSGTYKIYRDGSASRRVRGDVSGRYIYNTDTDRIISLRSSTERYYVDVMHHLYNIGEVAPIGYDAYTPTHYNSAIYRGQLYKGTSVAGTTTVTVRDLATGSTVTTFQTVATITPFACDRTWVTKDGILILADHDNGTYCVLQFYDIAKGTLMYETTVPRSWHIAVDDVHKNIWAAQISTSRLNIYSFQPAPATVSLALGSNRSRYRQDSITVTVTGSNNEKITNWPVGFRLYQPLAGGGFLGDIALGMAPLGSNGTPGNPAEGDLDILYGVTDENGQIVNLYCGPGAADYVGQTARIEAWTAY